MSFIFYNDVQPSLFENYLDYTKRLCEGENIEHFMQFVSVDTWGKQAEYIRPGLDFERLVSNVDRWLTEIPGRNSVTFIITMNNLVTTGLQQLLSWILELRAKHSKTYQRIWFDTPLLREPAWQSLTYMPQAYAWKLSQIKTWMQDQLMQEAHSFVGFKDLEIQRLSRVIDMVPGHKHTDKMADFYRFFSEHDRRHSLNFLDIFPEMSAFYDECRYHAHER